MDGRKLNKAVNVKIKKTGEESLVRLVLSVLTPRRGGQEGRKREVERGERGLGVYMDEGIRRIGEKGFRASGWRIKALDGRTCHSFTTVTALS